jgi:hypothetical protein
MACPSPFPSSNPRWPPDPTTPRIPGAAQSSFAARPAPVLEEDTSTAPRHAEQALAVARYAGPIGAFATYTMGEVRLLEDPAAAVEILELAATQAEAGRTAQIAEVARIALVSRARAHGGERRL